MLYVNRTGSRYAPNLPDSIGIERLPRATSRQQLPLEPWKPKTYLIGLMGSLSILRDRYDESTLCGHSLESRKELVPALVALGAQVRIVGDRSSPSALSSTQGRGAPHGFCKANPAKRSTSSTMTRQRPLSPSRSPSRETVRSSSWMPAGSRLPTERTRGLLGRQRLQRETASSRLQLHPVPAGLQRYLRIVRKGAPDILKFSCRGCQGRGFRCCRRGRQRRQRLAQHGGRQRLTARRGLGVRCTHRRQRRMRLVEFTTLRTGRPCPHDKTGRPIMELLLTDESVRSFGPLRVAARFLLR